MSFGESEAQRDFMTPIEYIAEYGPVTAPQIARHCNMLLGDVYGDLVAAEAKGFAVVVTEWKGARALTRWKLAPGVDVKETF